MIKNFFIFVSIISSVYGSQLPVARTELTVASYNCGGLPDHYDYIRAVCMHKIAQERHCKEPLEMAEFERLQNLALDSDSPQKWNHPILDADDAGNINSPWKERIESTLTTYLVRPIVIKDPEIINYLESHAIALDDLTAIRRRMAEKIFKYELPFDILALQETNYLDETVFPEGYKATFFKDNGVVWNESKFAFVRVVGTVGSKGLVIELREIETGRLIAFASAHFSGCHPFTAKDSEKGDKEMIQILNILDESEAEMKILAMDSNVTATHPRLSLMKERGYKLDTKNYLYPTCTHPWLVLDMRIDWIAIQAREATIVNIPVLGVGLNCPVTNMSDHRPIAAEIGHE